jgi:MFS family permease
VDGLETSTLAALYFLSAICSSIFLSLTNTLITEMYPNEYKEHFRIVQFSKRAAFLIGPIVMGAIIGVFGNRIGIIADAVSFFLSGIALYSIAAPIRVLIKSEIEESSETNNKSNFQKPKVLLFLASAIVALVGLAGGAVNSIELPYIITQLNLGSSFFGLSLALGGLGSISGLLIDKQIPNDYSSSKLIFLSISGLIISFIPWYFQSTYLFALALVLFGISITIFSNRTLFYLVDCYNGSSEVRNLFKDKPTLFLFYHQVDSVAMIIGAIISGIIADLFSTKESVHLIMLCLFISILTNFLFVRLSTHTEVK